MFRKNKKTIERTVNHNVSVNSNNVGFPENLPDLKTISDFNYQFFESFNDFIHHNGQPTYSQEMPETSYGYLFTQLLQRYNDRVWSKRYDRNKGVLIINDLKDDSVYLLYKDKWIVEENEILDLLEQDSMFWWKVERSD